MTNPDYAADLYQSYINTILVRLENEQRGIDEHLSRILDGSLPGEAKGVIEALQAERDALRRERNSLYYKVHGRRHGDVDDWGRVS